MKPKILVTLRKDFIDLLQSRDAMPKASAVEAWLKKNKLGVKNNAISNLLKGIAVSAIYAEPLVRYVIKFGEKDPQNKTYVALCDFIQSVTNRSANLFGPHEMAALILDNDDYLAGGPNRLFELLGGPFPFLNSAVGCSADEIRDVIEWMYVHYGRNVLGEVPLHEAEAEATKRIGATPQQFAQIAADWHRFDNWTITSVRDREQIVGTTGGLPLKEDVYQRFRSGELDPLEVSVDDLRRPSRYLLLLFAAPRPLEFDGPKNNVTTHLNFSLIHQLAILAHFKDEEPAFPLHIITFAPSPISKFRLESSGFKAVGTLLPRSKYPIYERKIPWNPLDNLSFMIRILRMAYGQNADAMLRPPKKTSADS